MVRKNAGEEITALGEMALILAKKLTAWIEVDFLPPEWDGTFITFKCAFMIGHITFILSCLCGSHLFYCVCANYIYFTVFVHITLILLFVHITFILLCLCTHHIYSTVFLHIIFILLCLCTLHLFYCL